MPDALRGHVPVGVVVLKSAGAGTGDASAAAFDPARVEAECVAAVRASVGAVGAVACLKRVLVVPRLPKTRSGKLLRNVLRAIAAGDTHIPVPPTIEDAAVLHEVHVHMHRQGVGNAPQQQPQQPQQQPTSKL